MHPSYHPRLINGPFDDPGLFIPFAFRKRAFLFDLGDLSSLSSGDILKVSHVFVSHTHMDHFIGFDRLLRLHLGREKRLYLYGPEGFSKHVEGKLNGYAWNLVGNYTQQLEFHVTEVRSGHLHSRRYRCRDRFRASGDMGRHPFDGCLVREPAFTVSAVLLDHGLPCLGFKLEERYHINIVGEELQRLGLAVGPWLNRFKQALYDGVEPGAEFSIPPDCRHPEAGVFTLGELRDRIARITPGQKIVYIVDAGAGVSNIEKIVDFARDADQLFIEAAFLDADRRLAEEKCHLTARQAGHLAGRAGARQYAVFHFSPRYTEREKEITEEAQHAYRQALSPPSA